MIKLLQNNESNNKKGKTHLTHKSKNNSDKPNFMLNGAFLCSLETHIARDLFGGNSGGLLKIGEKRERRKAPPARRRVRVLSFWRNFLVVVVLLTLGLLRFVVHSFWRFRWERGFVGVREEKKTQMGDFYCCLRNNIMDFRSVEFVSISFWIGWRMQLCSCKSNVMLCQTSFLEVLSVRTTEWVDVVFTSHLCECLSEHHLMFGVLN